MLYIEKYNVNSGDKEVKNTKNFREVNTLLI